MVTAMLTLVALVLVLAVAVMAVQVCRGCFFATVWWCCGGFTATAELIGSVVAAILAGLTGND